MRLEEQMRLREDRQMDFYMLVLDPRLRSDDSVFASIDVGQCPKIVYYDLAKYLHQT